MFGNNIVTDGRVLRAMARRNLIKWPVDHGHKYVDEEDRKRLFSYKGHEYRITYITGCFYPFVVAV